VEHPEGGGTLRKWAPINDGYSENLVSLTGNKCLVALKLKAPTDLELQSRMGE
jgi:hypothetical protein